MDSLHELSELTPLFKLVYSWGSGPNKKETKVLSHWEALGLPSNKSHSVASSRSQPLDSVPVLLEPEL